MTSNKASPRGFSLLELLIVVAIIGVLSAIAIPTLWNSTQRAKQKRTMADMRAIATAWEAYAVDHNAYSAAGASTPPTALNWSKYSTLSYKSISKRLSPTYMRTSPSRDGWNRSFEFAVATSTNPGLATLYAIRSLGSDGKQSESGVYLVGPRKGFECDIIYSTGAFVAYPAGAQASSLKSSTKGSSDHGSHDD